MLPCQWRAAGVTPAAVRASAGASIIWESPLGPLRLDISKPFLKERFDDEQLIRFGASTRF